MEPEPRSRRYGTTGWVSHGAGPTLTSIMSLARVGGSDGRKRHGRAPTRGTYGGNNRHPVRAAHLGQCEPANCATASGSSRVRSEMKLVINGADVELDARCAKTPLSWVPQDVVGLHDTKFGGGAGFCAARTVLIDGRKHEVLLDRDRAGGGQGNHHSRGGPQPGCRRRPHSKAVSAGSKPCHIRRARRSIRSGAGSTAAPESAEL